MKKKFITSALAIASAAVLTLSFTGCKKEKEIDKAEFVDAAYSSYAAYTEAYEKAVDDIKTFSGLSIAMNTSREMSETEKWAFTPDNSEAEVKEEYTSTRTSSTSANVDMKTIDDVLHLFVTSTEKSSSKGYELPDTTKTNTAKVAKYSISETTMTWEFGKDGEDFYARLTKSEKVGESFSENPTLGEAEETKEYMTFADEDMYMATVGQYLMQYCRIYIDNAYDMLADAEDEYDTIQYFKAKKGDTYKVTGSVVAFSEGKSTTNATVTFNGQGITGIEAEMEQTAPNGNYKMAMNYTVNYSSDKAAVSNPFTGYEEVPYFSNFGSVVVYPY